MPEPARAAGITGVFVRPLQILPDERGAVMHMLRADAPHFERFGEIYFSVVNPGAIKAWRRHRSTVTNIAVPVGAIRLVMYDERDGSATRGTVMELDTGRDAYSLITIPAGVWSGFLGLGAEPAIVANCATAPHDPAEIDRRTERDAAIPYVWGARAGS